MGDGFITETVSLQILTSPYNPPGPSDLYLVLVGPVLLLVTGRLLPDREVDQALPPTANRLVPPMQVRSLSSLSALHCPKVIHRSGRDGSLKESLIGSSCSRSSLEILQNTARRMGSPLA